MTPAGANARELQSIVANLLARPETASQLSSRIPDDLDLVALARFAGLAEKVRHNGVRSDLQLTFRALRLSGLEIELFAAFAPTSSLRRRAGLTSPADRLTGLLDFTREWAGDDVDRCLVRDLLAHEVTIARLRRPTAGSDEPSPEFTVSTVLTPRSVLGRAPGTVVLSATCDIAQASEVIKGREPDLAAIPRGPQTNVYRRVFDGNVRVLTVDLGISPLLGIIDGRSSLAELAVRLLGPSAAPDSLIGLCTELVRTELLHVADTEDARCA